NYGETANEKVNDLVINLAMGILTVFTALNYSELGAAIPVAGGGYSFVSRTLSRPISFFTGWFFWIGNTLACALYAVIFALSIRAYFLPDVNIALLAILTTLVFTLINLRGISEAIKIITIMNLIELAVLVGIGIMGIAKIEPANLQPLAPMGLGPLIPAMALIYISYVGFELITVAAEEIKDPAKNIPRAILITLGVGTAIYVFIVWVMMGTVHYTELAQSEIPFIFVAERIFGTWGRWAGITATIMASLSAFSVTLGASSRVLYALGRDGHIPKFFSKIHLRYRTPHFALYFCALIVIVFSSSGIVKFVASLSDFGYLMGLGFVNYAVISMQKRMPNLRRRFKVLLFPVVPILGVISCWAFVPALELRSLFLGGLLTLGGGGIYLLQSANRAELVSMSKTARSRIKYLSLRLRRKRMRVLIIDGSNHAMNIAQRLLAQDEYRMIFRSNQHQITFVEQDEGKCKEIEQRFNVPVYQGDGSKKELLQQIDLNNMDVAIAASGDDGRNVIVALQAKSMGIEKVIAILQDPDYRKLLEENEVIAVSAPWATAAMVENILDRPGLTELLEIEAGVAGIVGVIVPKNSKVVGQLIKDMTIPKNCVVAAVLREKQYVVPRGNTEIKAGDHVFFVGATDAITQVNKIICGG
ncbi:MAG: amino acid permease, partial [Methanosarcinaceae archaeon]|nr:amino acid permease [Methanosarcinaceae archaeon]